MWHNWGKISSFSGFLQWSLSMADDGGQSIPLPRSSTAAGEQTCHCRWEGKFTPMLCCEEHMLQLLSIMDCDIWWHRARETGKLSMFAGMQVKTYFMVFTICTICFTVLRIAQVFKLGGFIPDLALGWLQNKEVNYKCNPFHGLFKKPSSISTFQYYHIA
jgi:hypothetical protein